MVLNADQFHFLNFGFNDPLLDFSFNNTAIENVTEEEITGIVNENELKFKSHLKNICENDICTLQNIKIKNP